MAFGGVVLGSAISAVVGIFGIIMFATIYATINWTTTNIPLDVKPMLDMIPLVLTIVIVLSVLVGGLAFVLGGRNI